MLTNILIHVLEYGILIPSMLIILVLVMPYRRFFSRKMYLLYGIGTVIVIFICSVIDTYTDFDRSDYLLLLILFLLILATVNLPIRKLLYLFTSETAVLSFAIMVSELSPFSINPEQTIVPVLFKYLIIYAIAILFLGLIIRIRSYVYNLINTAEADRFWNTAWIIPCTITILNIYMVPESKQILSVGRIYPGMILVEIGLMIIFLFSQHILFSIAAEMKEKYLLQNEAEIYKLMSDHQEKVQDYITRFTRIRHDFKHVLITIEELVNNEDYPELKQYVAEYLQEDTMQHEPSLFCHNLVINALLNYYAEYCNANHINYSFQVDFPETPRISELDLSITIGNLLDNATKGCMTVDAAQRYIYLRSDNNTVGSLYITLTNSFDGTIIAKGNKIRSRWQGEGIGLSSIQSIAGKYNGFCQFEGRDREFYSNVMLETPEDTDEEVEEPVSAADSPSTESSQT